MNRNARVIAAVAAVRRLTGVARKSLIQSLLPIHLICAFLKNSVFIYFCDKKQHLDPEFSCVSCSLVELTKDILSKGIMLDEEVVSAPSYLSSRHGINIVFPLDVILASDLYC